MLLGIFVYNGKIFNWNGEWLRRKSTLVQKSVFYSEGGSLPFIDSNFNLNDDFYWGRFLSVTYSEPKWVRTDQGNHHTVCQYHGI